MTIDPRILAIAQTTLSPKQYAAWDLWENHQLGYTRIADRLGISTSSARDRVHRAIRNLEPHLEQEAA